MKIEEITRQEGGLGNLDVVCYALDDEGRYTTGISSGWEPKTIAMEASLRMVDEQTEEALRQVMAGKRSPIVFYMARCRMDRSILAGYMNTLPVIVRLHSYPSIFDKLSEKTLQRYADIFMITTDELKHPKP